MQNISPEQLQLLDDKSVKYAIAMEARDAVHAYLKYWAGFIGAMALIAGWLGFSLHSQLDALNTTVTAQTQRVADLDRRAGDLARTVTSTETVVTALTKDVAEKQRDLDEKERALGNKADQLYDRAGHFAEMAVKYDSETHDTLRRIAQAADDSERKAVEARAQVAGITVMKKEIESTAASAKTEGETLSTIMNRARDFDSDIDTHRRVFSNALLDYFTLTSKADSPDLRLTSADGKTFYKVVFHTGRDIASGFTLSYDVSGCKSSNDACENAVHHDKVIHFTRSRRDWFDIDGTNGQYQFAVDYVFVSAFAKNFVTIRVGATDKLLPASGAQATVAHVASR